DEARALEHALAADPAARAQFEELKRLFAGLNGVPKAYPPEGLVASVLARMAQQPPRRQNRRHIFSRTRVIRPPAASRRGITRARSSRVQSTGDFGSYSRGENMSEQQRGFSKRKVWIGIGIAAAAAAAVVGIQSMNDFGTSGQATMGTVVPANRYRATQGTD